ncbi:hypothetical protein K490DRAFT_69298 [Saccharata proteae CBS 121410]|uniref:F-box domain-containing protein n=1 Tax=Saccharata proteae CBS 121410 TaxID=1314787 RepID=A0A9P4HLP6_9PEZI|nr:hypothetical protein K490DRAFT_69298 [Saccharata proteae CBS 121410]
MADSQQIRKYKSRIPNSMEILQQARRGQVITLESLPTEIIERILSYLRPGLDEIVSHRSGLDSSSDSDSAFKEVGHLQQTLRASSRLRAISERVVYRGVFLNDTQDENGSLFLRTLRERPDFSEHLRHASISYPHSDAGKHTAAIISLAPRLETLDIHTHAESTAAKPSQDKQIGVHASERTGEWYLDAVIRHASEKNSPFLQSLIRCTLVARCDVTRLSLNDKAFLFFLPRLEVLQLSSMTWKSDPDHLRLMVEKSGPLIGKTALKSLFLDYLQCPPKVLKVLLRLPKALKVLELTSLRSSDGVLGGISIAGLLDALNTQAHSLESLTINRICFHTPDVFNVSHYNSLLNLKLEAGKLFGMQNIALAHARDWVPPATCILPSSLKSLILDFTTWSKKGDRPGVKIEGCLYEAIWWLARTVLSKQLPNLETLVFDHHDQAVPESDVHGGRVLLPGPVCYDLIGMFAGSGVEVVVHDPPSSWLWS